MRKLNLLILFSIIYFLFSCSGGGGSSSSDNDTMVDNTTNTDNSTGSISDNQSAVDNSTGVVSDSTAPSITSTLPANGANSIPISNNITLTFSEEMDATTINSTNISVVDSSGTGVSGVVSYSSQVATFNPSSDLSYFTVYTVTVGTGVKDSAGNALASSSSWNFTTSSAPDTTAPTISSTSPTSGADNVSVSANITITFSESMDSSTINTSNITVTDSSGNSVSGVVSYSNNIATFNPTSDLGYLTVFTVTTGIGVQDTSGNALASSSSFSFTTAAPPPSITLTSTAFTENGNIPAVYTCNSTDISPELSWSGNLDTAVSFAIIMDDPDAPCPEFCGPGVTSDVFTHWMIYNIPGSTRGLSQNVSALANLPDGSIQLTNDMSAVGYRGPCPPSRHRYDFKIYALNDNLSTSISSKSELTNAMSGKIVAQDTYSGFYP